MEVEGYDEDEGDLEEIEDQSGVEPVFTAEDEQDLLRLEAGTDAGVRATFTKVREIRQRRLWMTIKDDHGQRIYKTFETYVRVAGATLANG